MKDELEAELSWAQGRVGSMAHGQPELTLASEEPFAKSLTFGEDRFLASYRHSRPGQAWQLNQNPDSGFGSSSNDTSLPTVIANMHMLYTDRVVPGRWLAGSEALSTQGFPVMPFLWNIRPEKFPPLCTFNIPSSTRTSRRMLTQAGNSMNVMVMSVLMLHGLLEWELKPEPSLLACIRLSRAVALGSKRASNFEDRLPPAKRLRTKTKEHYTV